MEAFWGFMNTTGWAITFVSIFFGLLSWNGSRRAEKINAEGRTRFKMMLTRIFDKVA